MSDPKKTAILLIEDQAMVRHGLVALINSLTGYHVAAAVGSVPEALAQLHEQPVQDQEMNKPSAEQRFALVLSDYHLGGDTAASLLRYGKKNHLPPVLLLTSVCNAAELQQAVTLGARGLLYKECNDEELVRAFDSVCAGGVYFASGLGLSSAPPISDADIPAITPTEREILQWLATGMSNKEIARLLDKSAETVKIQVSQLLRKLNCKTRTEAVVNASRRGLI